MNPPVKRFTGDLYAFHWPDEHVDMVLDRLHESRSGDLTAEVEVRCSRDTPRALLHHARINLISTRSRADLIKALANRIPERQIDWSAAVEQACHYSLQQWREGDPIIDLRDVPPREGTRFLLEPYIELGGPTIIFADGGSGKSVFGLAIAVSIASGEPVLGVQPATTTTVLYLDWESDAETHGERRTAICAGAGIEPTRAPILYRRQSASLPEVAPGLRRTIAERRIGFVVVDSMAAARGSEPESADATIRLFNAARSLGVPWLGIDHITKNGGEGQAKPFGSVFTHNLARLTWSLEKIEEYANGKAVIALENRKANNGKKQPRRGYDIEWREDSEGRTTFVGYASKDPRDIPGLFTRLTQAQQIEQVIRDSGGRVFTTHLREKLAECGVNIPDNQLRAVLTNNPAKFVRLDSGRPGVWGLRV